MAGGNAAELRVLVLGPVRAFLDERELNLGASQQRAVLAVLALSAGRVVPREKLIDAVWDVPPDTARGAVDKYISGLRKVLEPGRTRRVDWQILVTSKPGYSLRADVVDAVVFTGQVAAARQALAAGDLVRAAGLLDDGLGLWQGLALAGVAGRWAEGQRARLDEARLAAVELHAEALLALGQPGEVVGELAELARGDLTREELVRLLMQALYQCGRQREALRVFRDCRQVLREELGIEPGPGLQDMQQRILAADPGLAAPGLTVTLVAAVPLRVPRELPSDVPGFTGRVGELAAMDALSPATEVGAAGTVVCVVSGMAGVGKTALAVRWAHRVASRFPDGQLYVDLRGYDPGQPVLPGQVLAGFLQALGVEGQTIPAGEVERGALFRSLVAGRRLLVVLDNAWDEEQVRLLMPGGGPAAVVVTSRNALPGLVARDGARRLELDVLPAREAAGLLRELIGDRATQDPLTVEALAGLCAGLPLALRVAAELAVSRPGEQLAALVTELEAMPGRLELLDAGGDVRSAVASVFSWSYQHLEPTAGRMFRVLGLHPGPDWDPYAAAALAGTSPQAAGRLLGVLARAHLIQPAGPGRYGLHDLLRAYAAGLAAENDAPQARHDALTGLLGYYQATCELATSRISPARHRPGPAARPAGIAVPALADRAAALAWLDGELPALTAATAHADTHDWPHQAVGLAATLYRYLAAGHDPEGMIIHRHALQAARRLGDRAAQATVLSRLAQFCNRRGGHQQAADYARRSLALARAAGDQTAQARALTALALTAYVQGRYRSGVIRYRQAITACQQVGDQVRQAACLGNLGLLYAQLGRYQQATTLQQQALDFYQQFDDPYGISYALNGLAETRYRQGDHPQAARLRQQALTHAEQIGDPVLTAEALTGLGSICTRQGNYAQAADYHQQALTLFERAGVSIGQATALNGAGETQLARGQPGLAHQCHTRAQALARQAGDRWEEARAVTRLTDTCRHQGHYPQASKYASEAVSSYQAMGSWGGHADALTSTAEVLLATGQPAQARARATAALAKARQAGDRYQQARAHHALARAYQDSGQPARARQHHQHSQAITASLGIPPPAG